MRRLGRKVSKSSEEIVYRSASGDRQRDTEGSHSLRGVQGNENESSLPLIKTSSDRLEGPRATGL